MMGKLILLFAVILTNALVYGEDQSKPNILRVITDDQRPDSLAAFNQTVNGTKLSPLGYVLSPHGDKLAQEGTLFTQAYCNSLACAPSRTSIHTGRYPFRNGIYGFEQVHAEVDASRPTLPQVMRQAGYVTASMGKHGYRIFEWGSGFTWTVKNQYDFAVDKKNDLMANGRSELNSKSLWGKEGYQEKKEIFYYPDGSSKEYYVERKKGESLTEEDVATRKTIDVELDILRAYTRTSELMIIGGESSQPPDKTQDGEITNSFIDYLENQVDPSKPLFLNLGFHFPHTPVLAPTFYDLAGVNLDDPAIDHLGELNHVIGPRAYIRSKEFAFSMRTRPTNGKPGAGPAPGAEIRWALDCPRDKAEMAFYDLRSDPKERWNVVNDTQYQKLADWFHQKLGAIVLGDRRMEVNWKKENDYAITDFAVRVDDKNWISLPT